MAGEPGLGFFVVGTLIRVVFVICASFMSNFQQELPYFAWFFFQGGLQLIVDATPESLVGIWGLEGATCPISQTRCHLGLLPIFC